MAASTVDGELMALLGAAPLRPCGFLANASNHTLLVRVGEPRLGVHGVYKPRAGERPLRDFPAGTLCQRESAAYAVSAFLGWDLVPPTVLRDGPMGPGSVQLFVPHDPALHYFVLAEDEEFREPLARMATFDLLVNNADRKASHVLLGADGLIRGCDHGLTFHARSKLRTVIWDFGGEVIQPAWRADLARLGAALDDAGHDLVRELGVLLSAEEVELLALRALMLADTESLPDVDGRRRPYPWPPL